MQHSGMLVPIIAEVRVVPLAVAGMAFRTVGHDVGRTPGAASKWRPRYARDC